MVIEQVRALVPGWVEWLGPVLFLVGWAAIVALVPIAAVRVAVRRINPADHWTEQARFGHAARMSIVWAAATAPAGVWLLSTVTIGPVGWLPPWLFGTTGAATAVLVVARVSWWLEGTVLQQPVLGWRRYLEGFLVRLAPLAAIIVLGSGKLFRDTVEYISWFEGSVNGLNPGAPVKFMGVRIGQVTAIRLRAGPPDEILDTEEEFENYMNLPVRSYSDFKIDPITFSRVAKLLRIVAVPLSCVRKALNIALKPVGTI